MTAKSTKKTPQEKSRKVKNPDYKSFRMSKRIKRRAPLPSVYSISRTSLGVLKRHWKLYGGILLIYGLLTVVLVKGFGGGLNLTELKDTLEEAFGGASNSLASGAGLFALLVASAGSSNTEGGSIYQSILLVITSLALIWALRQTTAGHKIRIRDSFYSGMYPLIPFLLVLCVIGLQFIPLLVGSWLYSTVLANAIAITTIEKALWLVVFLLLATLSLYMICSSLFALYVATLPDMTPLKALRSARQLVLHRRWQVLRKILFLPLLILVIFAVIIIPLIIFLTPAAEWAFFALTVAALAIVHSYVYTLYRELLV